MMQVFHVCLTAIRWTKNVDDDRPPMVDINSEAFIVEMDDQAEAEMIGREVLNELCPESDGYSFHRVQVSPLPDPELDLYRAHCSIQDRKALAKPEKPPRPDHLKLVS